MQIPSIMLVAVLLSFNLIGMNTKNLPQDTHKSAAEIHKAAHFGITYDLEELLQAGGDPNVQQEATGNMPLHLSIQAGHIPCVKILLKHKAAVNTANVEGLTPQRLA